MAIPRMRTADQLLAEIKKEDPNTSVTLSYIRRVIREEKIPVVSAGKKKLVDMDVFIKFLEKGDSPEEPAPNTYGTIRRVV